MKRHYFYRPAPTGALIASLLLSAAGWAGAQSWPDVARVKTLLRERVEANQTVGIVLGVVDEHGTHLEGSGTFSRSDKRPVDGDTLFEIGSSTKVFTSLLLAEMAERGKVKLDDPVAMYLPATVKVPTRGTRQITLTSLSTHRSGLPRLPDNLSLEDTANPYASYTVPQLYQFLSGYELTRDIDSQYEYSNLGAGLLGHALSLRSGLNYESLVKQRICLPLGMSSTVITLDAAQKTRLAAGHGASGRQVSNWDLPTLAGAGAFRSSANDLLKFVAANLGLNRTPLLPAMKVQQMPRQATDIANTKIGLGWHITSRYGGDIIWHNGETGGYHSFLGFDLKTKRGVVVLANTANRIDDLGFHMLEPKYEVTQLEPIKLHAAVKVDAKILKRYVGRYQFSPAVSMNVKTEGDHLAIQLTGQGFIEVFPEAEKEFFCEVVDAQVSFVTDAQGKPTSLVLHQNKQDQTAKWVSAELPKEKAVARVDPKVFELLAGKYELSPGAEFTVKRDGAKLMVQLTGQPFFEIFPTSDLEYFYKIVDAQIKFVKGPDGQISELVLHQGGMDLKARRLR